MIMSRKEAFTEENMSFDTHKYVKEIMATGMPEEQAAVIVRLVHDSRDFDRANLATKDQLVLVEINLKSSIERLEQKLDSSIERLEQKLDSSIERLEQKLDSSIERLEHKSDSSIEKLEQKLDSSIEILRQEISAQTKSNEQRFKHIEETIATKEDLAKLLARMEKKDASQKVWMISFFLTMLALLVPVVLKLY